MYHTLIAKLQQTNIQLTEKYAHVKHHQCDVRQKLVVSGARMRQMKGLSQTALKQVLAGRKVAAVDGSVNQTKGIAPHVLYVFQALAKAATGESAVRSDIYVPLLEERDEKQSNRCSYLLSKLELEAACALLEKEDVRLLLMDGALYHYRIDAPEEWERLAMLAVARGTWLVGVSEKITTENLRRLPAFSDMVDEPYAYDRDLLFGALKQNEMVFVEAIQRKAGLQSVWMRLGSTPAITGFDILEQQAHDQEVIGDLLCTLTPKEGRGIPLWLDYIDRKVRVTDQLVAGLVEQYIDPALRQKFFTRIGQERPY